MHPLVSFATEAFLFLSSLRSVEVGYCFFFNVWLRVSLGFLLWLLTLVCCFF